MDVHRVQHLGGRNVNPMKGLSVAADVACREFRKGAFVASDLKLSANGENGVFLVEPVTMRAFGAQGSGSMRANFTGVVPRYDVHYSLPQLYIEEFFKTLSPKKVAEGQMDFSMDLTMRGHALHEMRRTMEGQISLRGENLTFHGSDLDREFSRFESSQNFSLVDVGAFFFAGPLGLVVTKGYNFASVVQGSGGNSRIRTLVSDWKVERGVAQAQDVAMATSKNRVALHGGLDFADAQFDDVTVALIDKNGCAKVQQRVSGAFRHPVVEKPGVVKSLTGPALALLKKGRDLFPGGECEVFYAGSVAPPT
jgi:AsmA protein